jgi:beta-phosphoglucomutase-like phosphatase (HAD superfamily)
MFLKRIECQKRSQPQPIEKQAEAQLSGLGLLDRFDTLATGDETANGKPAPDLFLLAAQRLGVHPSACVVLEDSEAGIIAANRAGMQVYVIPDLKQPSLAVERLAQGKFDSLLAVIPCIPRILNSEF